jgi:hypothetical protein
MSFSLDYLVDELSASEIWTVLFALADLAGLPITAMQPTEAPRSLITTTSSWFASLWNTTIRNAIRAQYGDFVVDAGRTWATFWGLSLFGEAPYEADFAQGPCLLTNTKGGSWSFNPGTFFVKNTLTTKTYKNIETVTLAPWPGSGAYPTQTVNFRAVEPGSGFTSSAGGIDALVTSANGVTVTNAASLVGQDEEPLTDFVLRARGTPALLSPNGPKAAYDTILRRTLRADGSRIAVNRTRTRTPTGNGLVRTIVAGPSGALPGTDVARLLLNAQTLVEPWGTTAQVASAANVNVNYAINAFARTSPTVSSLAIQTAGLAAIQAFLLRAPIGGFNTSGGDDGFIYSSELAAIVSEANAEVFKAENSSVDVVIGAEEVGVLGTGTITPVIV